MDRQIKTITDGDLAELEFLEALAARLPEDDLILKALGDLCTRVGRYERGLEIDETIVRLCPDDPVVWYNLGCSLALLSRRPEALVALATAVQFGYDDYEWMSRDDDLLSLREDREFKALLQRIAT